MFTVHIQSPCGLQQVIQRWPSVSIVRKGHSTFDENVRLLAERLRACDLSDEQIMKRLNSTSVILSGAPQSEDLATLEVDCKCYITNDAGKTIATIK